MKLFVEGGGDSNQLKTECRKGVTDFITKAGVSKRPRIVACGSRENAFDSFCTEIKSGNQAMLLVDSEEPVQAGNQSGDPVAWKPWAHLKNRAGDGWDKPAGANDTDCHFMVVCMENWFLADRKTLASFFGDGFHQKSLPVETRAIETIGKAEVYTSLKSATRPSKLKEYGKGAHSFKLLSSVDASRVIAASPWAKRFIDELKKAMVG